MLGLRFAPSLVCFYAGLLVLSMCSSRGVLAVPNEQISSMTPVGAPSASIGNVEVEANEDADVRASGAHTEFSTPRRRRSHCLDAVNKYRKKKSLAALKLCSSKYQAKAKEHAEWDAKHGFHNWVKTKGWSGACGGGGGEGQCEAEGQSTEDKAIEAYYNEWAGGGHYDILMSHSDKCVACGLTNGHGGRFYTHNFCHSNSAEEEDDSHVEDEQVRSITAVGVPSAKHSDVEAEADQDVEVRASGGDTEFNASDVSVFENTAPLSS